LSRIKALIRKSPSREGLRGPRASRVRVPCFERPERGPGESPLQGPGQRAYLKKARAHPE